MRGPETLAAAVLDIEAILSAYLKPGPRDADRTVMAILERLDRDDVPPQRNECRLASGDCEWSSKHRINLNRRH
ncbi:MAG: hypothetical protein EON54_16865 [Alcaligenaceae bacterium]|nr:MAG: hypothetical protein EON54_16865 [Alcaligenaceae bacterium]